MAHYWASVCYDETKPAKSSSKKIDEGNLIMNTVNGLITAFGVALALCAEGQNVPVVENFNSYGNGLIVGQGGWFDREHGETFSVESVVTYEGAKALGSANQTGLGIITKTGVSFADGYQSFYFYPEQHSTWGSPLSFQLGVYQDSWDGTARAAMDFRSDGHAYHTDATTGPFVEFGTFADNVWNLAEIEWRASDKSARYQIDNEGWSEWSPFTGGGSFTHFNTVGISAIYMGSGNVYVDDIGLVVPEPAAISLLGLGFLVFSLRKRSTK